MARLNDRRSVIAAERLRVVISRSPGGYSVNLKKWSKRLGVAERSVERYLQRGGGNRRFIRDPEAKKKIDRAFNYQRRKRIDFIPFDMILTRGEVLDVTRWMHPELWKDDQPVLALLLTIYNKSVWLPNADFPRVLFQTDGNHENVGIGFSRSLTDLMTPGGDLVAEGSLTDMPVGESPSFSTFGDVPRSVTTPDGKKAVWYRGNPSDGTIRITGFIEDWLRFVGSSVVCTRIIFDPILAIERFPDFNEAEKVGTAVRNRNPVVIRNAEGKFIRLEWNEVKP